MADHRFPPGDEELHAFIDGELDAGRAAEVGKAVENDLTLSRRIAAYRAGKLRLRQAYAGIAAEELPQQWLDMIDRHAQRPRRAPVWRRLPEQLIAAAAVILVLVLGWGLGRELPPAAGDDAIVREALAARAQTLPPQQVVPAAGLTRGGGSDGVLRTALAMKVKTPDLARLGYRLEDLRVYAGVPGGKAVELDYRNADNGLFTLYLRHPSSAPKVDIVERGGVRICLWQDDVLGAVMAGKMTAGEMARLASLAYSGLTL